MNKAVAIRATAESRVYELVVMKTDSYLSLDPSLLSLLLPLPNLGFCTACASPCQTPSLCLHLMERLDLFSSVVNLLFIFLNQTKKNPPPLPQSHIARGELTAQKFLA